jgi:hypothetical protein
MPSPLLLDLALTLAEAGKFDQSLALFHGHYFEQEEGGTHSDVVLSEVRLQEALSKRTSFEPTQTSPRIEYYLGILATNAGDNTKAQAHWRRAAASSPDDPFSLLAMRRLGDGQWRVRAEAALQKRIGATYRGAAVQRGLLLRMLGRQSDAELEFIEVLRQPDFNLSHYLARRALANTDGIE